MFQHRISGPFFRHISTRSVADAALLCVAAALPSFALAQDGAYDPANYAWQAGAMRHAQQMRAYRDTNNGEQPTPPVIPKFDIVVAMTGFLNDNEFYSASGLVDDISSAVKSDRPLPENPVAQALLVKAIQRAAEQKPYAVVRRPTAATQAIRRAIRRGRSPPKSPSWWRAAPGSISHGAIQAALLFRT